MNRFYQGDWMGSIASDLLMSSDDYIKNSFAEKEDNEFEFNQDIEFESEVRSPGWIRYQKKLK